MPESADGKDDSVLAAIPWMIAEMRPYYNLHPGRGQGTLMTQDLWTTWIKIMRWPLRPPQYYVRLSYSKNSWRSHLLYQPITWTGLLHRPTPFPRPKGPPITPPSKALYQWSSRDANQVQTAHNKQEVSDRNPNLMPITTVISRRWPVLTRATLTRITPSWATTRL